MLDTKRSWNAATVVAWFWWWCQLCGWQYAATGNEAFLVRFSAAGWVRLESCIQISQFPTCSFQVRHTDKLHAERDRLSQTNWEMYNTSIYVFVVNYHRSLSSFGQIFQEARLIDMLKKCQPRINSFSSDRLW